MACNCVGGENCCMRRTYVPTESIQNLQERAEKAAEAFSTVIAGLRGMGLTVAEQTKIATDLTIEMLRAE